MPKNIGRTLKECRTAAKMTVKEISDLLSEQGYKASESTIYSWENDNSQPTPGALLSMCIAYGIDDVLATFGYNGYKEDGSLQLTLGEYDLIEKYRSLDDHGKDMVDTVLDKEWQRSTAEKKTTAPISITEARANKDLEADAANQNPDATPEQTAFDDDVMDDPDF